MKYWFAIPLVMLSGCGLGPVLCKSDVRVALDEPESAIRMAERNLERGYFWGREVVSLRSDDLDATTDDPDLRTGACTRLDLQGVERPYTCFYRVVDFPTEETLRLRVVPSEERAIIAQQTPLANKLRATFERDLAACEEG
ncbi:hypothetical protein [Yoonia sp. 2307UL14-13]|uniref:hypothetical protein n=1 Tax=Yoonia sp. 2307UL14-13 TaxID=3126506 RepID=UPI00309B916D